MAQWPCGSSSARLLRALPGEGQCLGNTSARHRAGRAKARDSAENERSPIAGKAPASAAHRPSPVGEEGGARFWLRCPYAMIAPWLLGIRDNKIGREAAWE